MSSLITWKSICLIAGLSAGMLFLAISPGVAAGMGGGDKAKRTDLLYGGRSGSSRQVGTIAQQKKPSKQAKACTTTHNKCDHSCSTYGAGTKTEGRCMGVCLDVYDRCLNRALGR